MRYAPGYEVLWFVVFLCEALWAARIWRLGLVRTRPFLFAYLIVGLPKHCVSFAIRWLGPEDPSVFRLYWAWTQPLYWVFTLLVLVETYNRVFGRFKGFRTVAQVLLRATSIGAGALYFWMVFQGPLPQSWYYFWQAHALGFFVSATTFFFLLAAFARYFQVPLTANDRLVIVAFGLMIGGAAMGVILEEIWGNGVHYLRVAIGPVVTLATCTIGALRFSREGEVPDLARGEMPVADAAMLENLDVIRRTLGKTRRQ